MPIDITPTQTPLPTQCACECAAEIAKLEKQLAQARRMVEGGFDRTSIITNIQQKITKLQNKQAQCKAK